MSSLFESYSIWKFVLVIFFIIVDLKVDVHRKNSSDSSDDRVHIVNEVNCGNSGAGK